MLKEKLQRLTGHQFVKMTSRGNTAITEALTGLTGKVLIPEEGGWLSYYKIPQKLGLEIVEVKCEDARLNLEDLSAKVKGCSAFLYQNPGGYHAEQPMQEIYEICKENNCLVIMDVSGSIGTDQCDGRYADIMVGSFGKGKLVNAGQGGFISGKDDSFVEEDELILRKLEELPARIKFLLNRREKIIKDLAEFKVVNKDDLGFVVVVKYETEAEKENLINYCIKNNIEHTECPRYIRLNEQAISIEIKRLENDN